MAQFDKTFPTLDCAACILTPKMVSAGTHPNITLLTWSEVEKVEGYVGNFTVTVRKKARYVNEDLCNGCGVCQEKCPKKVVDEVFEAGLGYRKAIYTPFAQAVPEDPVIDRPNCTYFEKGTCKACEKFCETSAIDFDQEDTILTLQVGNIILATGYDLFDARKMHAVRLRPAAQRLHQPRVRAAVQLGRPDQRRTSSCATASPSPSRWRSSTASAAATGTTTTTAPRSAACRASSSPTSSRSTPRPTIYDFYIDMRTAGKGYDEFYQRILEEGGIFVRGKPAEITDVARTPEEEGKLIVQVEDTLVGRQRRFPVDMVILSSGLEPRADAKELAIRFGISCSFDGWAIEKHPKLDPVATMTEGVFIAGCVSGPKDIPASVAQGAAAAARVLGMIQQKQHEPRADQGHGPRGALLRLPHLQHHVPVQRHLLRRRHGRLEHQRGDVPGLRDLRRGLPGRSDLRHGLQRRAGPGPDRRPAQRRSGRAAAETVGLPGDAS